MREPILCGLILVTLVCAPAGASEAPDPSFEFALAKILADEGEVGEAFAAMERALAAAPGDPFLRLEYAQLLSATGQASAALEQAREARALAPEDADVLSGIADLLMTSADRDPEARAAALDVLEQIRRLRPENAGSMMELARLYYNSDRPADAAEVLLELIQHSPRSRRIHSFLINSLLRSNQTRKAESLLDDFLETDPEYLRGRLQLASLLSERGDHSGALAVLEAAPPELMDSIELQGRLAEQLYRTGEFERALASVDRVLDQASELAQARFLKARILAAEGLDLEALELLEGLRREQTTDLELTQLLLRLLERQEQPQRAILVLDELTAELDEAGNQAAATWARFEVVLLLARADSWQEVLERAATFPEADDAIRGELSLLRAEALLNLERSDEALAALAELTANPDLARRALAKEAEILLRGGREGDAERRIRRLVGEYGPEGVLAVAGIYHRLERYDDAIGVLSQVTEEPEGSVQRLYWLGAAYERNGQVDDAAEAFGALLELQPDFAPALNYLGYMWAENGQNLDRALELITRAVELDPENGAYVDSLGWALYQLGQYEAARPHLERAARLVPDDAIVFEHLGDLYVALGDPGRARDVYLKAVELGGDNTEAVRAKLERLGDS